MSSRTLCEALRVLADQIHSDDGVAAQCIRDAAAEIESLRQEIRTQRQEIAALREERAALIAADRPQADSL